MWIAVVFFRFPVSSFSLPETAHYSGLTDSRAKRDIDVNHSFMNSIE
jgi:hypothetical protein